MTESLIATLIFWSAFLFSPGAWWIAFMETARHTPKKKLARECVIYLFAGWLPLIVAAAALVRVVGGINMWVFIALHFCGGSFMLYLAYKTLASQLGKGAEITFEWKKMSLLAWSNPKSWLTIPVGSLAAHYTASTVANVVIFALLNVPLFVAAVLFWRGLALQGEKLARGKLSYINASLLVVFAGYLLYQGALLAVDQGG